MLLLTVKKKAAVEIDSIPTVSSLEHQQTRSWFRQAYDGLFNFWHRRFGFDEENDEIEMVSKDPIVFSIVRLPGQPLQVTKRQTTLIPIDITAEQVVWNLANSDNSDLFEIDYRLSAQEYQRFFYQDFDLVLHKEEDDEQGNPRYKVLRLVDLTKAQYFQYITRQIPQVTAAELLSSNKFVTDYLRIDRKQYSALAASSDVIAKYPIKWSQYSEANALSDATWMLGSLLLSLAGDALPLMCATNVLWPFVLAMEVLAYHYFNAVQQFEKEHGRKPIGPELERIKKDAFYLGMIEFASVIGWQAASIILPYVINFFSLVPSAGFFANPAATIFLGLAIGLAAGLFVLLAHLLTKQLQGEPIKLGESLAVFFGTMVTGSLWFFFYTVPGLSFIPGLGNFGKTFLDVMSAAIKTLITAIVSYNMLNLFSVCTPQQNINPQPANKPTDAELVTRFSGFMSHEEDKAAVLQHANPQHPSHDNGPNPAPNPL